MYIYTYKYIYIYIYTSSLSAIGARSRSEDLGSAAASRSHAPLQVNPAWHVSSWFFSGTVCLVEERHASKRNRGLSKLLTHQHGALRLIVVYLPSGSKSSRALLLLWFKFARSFQWAFRVQSGIWVEDGARWASTGLLVENGLPRASTGFHGLPHNGTGFHGLADGLPRASTVSRGGGVRGQFRGSRPNRPIFIEGKSGSLYNLYQIIS